MLTRPLLDALLARYEAMAEAARANDWDRLSALERDAAELRETARAGADAAADAATLATLPAAEAESLRAGIERLLALDAEIRTTPTLSSPACASCSPAAARNARCATPTARSRPEPHTG